MNSDMAYNRLFYIKNAPGINAKKALMVDDKEFKRILNYCYDPFKMYYMNMQPVRGQGTERFNDMTWRILDSLYKRQITGTGAFLIVRDHMKELTRKSAFLFNRILSKDMRIGVGPKTINAVFPGLIPEHKIMRAKLLEESRVRFPCWASPKVDGLRAIYRDYTFYMRGGKKFYGMEHLIKQLERWNIPMDGELKIPGWEFNDMSGQLRSDDISPLAVYYVWDLPDAAMSFHNRYEYVVDICNHCDNMVQPVEHTLVNSIDDIYKEYRLYRSLGYEGSVIKKYNYRYKDNRSYDWMKVKDVVSEDLEVTGVYEGKGKYKNMLGGVFVNRNGKTCKVGGGWSDVEREKFYIFPDEIIGRTIEVLFQEETKTGNMRHARKERLRYDKE